MNIAVHNTMIIVILPPKITEGINPINDAANPNGSLLNIAGICNEQRNVFGLMPHPERAADPDLNNTDGLEILRQLILETVS